MVASLRSRVLNSACCGRGANLNVDSDAEKFNADTLTNCSQAMKERPAGLIRLPLPHHDNAHRLVVDVRVRHRRALDEEPVAVETDGAHLLAADPGFVPGRLDLGDDLSALDAVATRISDHGFERRRPVRIGL